MQSAVFLILCLPTVLGHTLRRSVYIYNGYGSDENHVFRMQEQLNDRLGLDYEVKTIGASAVKEGVWMNDAALFVMPGGFDLGYLASLGDEGTAKIVEYVSHGGSYLGLGAGSYFACDNIKFDEGGDDEVVGPRPLKFYPGTCSGPVFGRYNYYDFSGARAANITLAGTYAGESSSMKAYYNGGNTFNLPMENQNTRCETLAVFTENNNSPAIVKCTVAYNNGVVVLTGVHLEFGYSHLARINDPDLQGVIEAFGNRQDHESKRLRVFDSMLCQLGLTTQCEVVVSNL